jgi:hypothetical protein
MGLVLTMPSRNFADVTPEQAAHSLKISAQEIKCLLNSNPAISTRLDMFSYDRGMLILLEDDGHRPNLLDMSDLFTATIAIDVFQNKEEYSCNPYLSSLNLKFQNWGSSPLADTLTIVVFLPPALSFVFVIYPIFQSLYYSLFNWKGFGPAVDFVGLKNLSKY